MKQSTKQTTRNDALRIFIKDNPSLSNDYVAHICECSIALVESWLSGDSDISEFQLYLIYQYVVGIRGTVRGEAVAIAKRLVARAYSIGRYQRKYNGGKQVTYIPSGGEVGRPEKEFKYRGAVKTIKELAEIRGIPVQTMKSRLKNCASNQDVTDIVDRPYRPHKKPV